MPYDQARRLFTEAAVVGGAYKFDPVSNAYASQGFPPGESHL